MTLTLREALERIQYDTSWGIWAESLHPESAARFGQRVFDGGGLNDGWIYICDGTQYRDFVDNWGEEGVVEEFLADLKDFDS